MRRRKLALLLAGMALGGAVLAIYPGGAIGWFRHLDIALHMGSGVAFTLILAAFTRMERDESILLAVTTLGVVWEPLEAYWFGVDLTTWMFKEDTLFDITLVAFGSALTLIALGRYR